MSQPRETRQAGAVGDDREVTEARARSLPVVVAERPRRTDPLGVVLRILAALALILIVALLAAMLLVLAGLLNTGDRLGGAVGGLGDIAGSAASSVRERAQTLPDRLDPAHPPRDAVILDPEYVELKQVDANSTLGSTAEYIVTLERVERRDQAASPEQAQYAVVHRRLIVPREDRILGVVVRTDADEADYYLYKGESFRLGRAYYKVNWVSLEQQAMAVVRYRNADGLTVPLKFVLD